jgi:hypothetical protein
MNTNTEFRLTDQLERELMLEAMNASETLKLVPFLKASGLAVVRAADKLLGFISRLNDAMDRAYNYNTRFASTQW